MKMSDVDLLIESTINEAPVGMLKRGALKVASKLGSQKAAGQEVTANIANQLKKEYSRYLGVTGYEPDKESIEAFLNSKGLSSDSLDTAISSVSDTGPTGQDWRIDTGPRTGATNQRVEPVVDIGSATDEVPALDGESPIEQARAKRIAAQQKAVQQLRGQPPTQQAEPTAKPNRLAGMGAGYVPPTAQEPEVAQPEPSATGTQAAPEVPAQEPTATRERPGISARAGKAGVSQPKVPQFTSASAMSKATAEKKAELDTKLQAIDDAKAALANSPRSGKLKDALKQDLKQAEADYDAFVSSEIKPADLKDKLATKVDQIKTGTTANTTPSDQFELPVNDAEPNQQTSTSSDANQDKIKKAQTEVDNKRAAFEIAKRDNPNLKSLYQDNKNGFMGRLNIAIKALANLTGEEPELETKPVSLTSTTDAVTKKAGKPQSPATNVSTATGKNKTSSTNQPEIPVADASADDATETDTTPSAASVDDSDIANIPTVETVTDALSKMDDQIKRLENNASIPQGRLDLWDNARDDLYTLQQSIKMANRIRASLAEIKTGIDNSKGAKKADYQKQYDKKEAAYDEQKEVVKVHYENFKKSKDAAIEKTGEIENASINHQYDFILAEAALTNKQVDKIILAVTQDNIRKGIISIPGVPKPKAKDKGKTAQAAGDQYSIGSVGSSHGGSTGGAGGQQYTQQAQQKSGGKTLDLSDLNVERLISAINHILKKEGLKQPEIDQLKKLMQELKAVREGRANLANQLTEAPMGLGQRLATGVASKFSAQAAGKLDAGKIANQYKPEYSRWLGTTGAKPDAQSLIDFFQSKRLDTSKIQQIADSVAPNATRLTGQQLDNIIMQITQDNIRKGVITPAAAAQASGQPAATQSTLPVMAQRMLTDPAVQSHPEYVRFLSGLK